MANDIFNYCVATNTGKGFITHDDSRKFWISGNVANVWVVTDTFESRLWIARNNGVTKTKSEAQAQKEYTNELQDQIKFLQHQHYMSVLL